MKLRAVSDSYVEWVGDAELKRRLTLNCTFDTGHLSGLHWGVSDYSRPIKTMIKEHYGRYRLAAPYSPGKMTEQPVLIAGRGALVKSRVVLFPCFLLLVQEAYRTKFPLPIRAQQAELKPLTTTRENPRKSE